MSPNYTNLLTWVGMFLIVFDFLKDFVFALNFYLFFTCMYMITIIWDRIYAPWPNESTAFSGLLGSDRMERPLLHHHHQNLRQWRRRRGQNGGNSVEWEMWLKKGIYWVWTFESIHKKPRTKDICVDFSITKKIRRYSLLKKSEIDIQQDSFQLPLKVEFHGWSTTMLDRGCVDLILTWQHHCIWLTILLALRKLMCCLV